MAHHSILDAILNEHRYAASLNSPALGDQFLDAPTEGHHGMTTAARRAVAAADADDSLADAAFMASRMTKQAKAGQDIRTIVDAIKFARSLPVAMKTAPVGLASKVAAVRTPINEALSRLVRISRKTAAEMQQDGARNLNDYLDPARVPLWAKQAGRDVALMRSLAKLVAPKTLAKQASTESLLKERKVTDEQALKYVRDLLNGGAKPRDVEEKLNKLAELEGYSRGFLSDKLKNDAGILGIVYQEPNYYMDSCPKTYQRQEVKLGGVRAKSVKRIAACTGCQHFNKAAMRCNLYRLPIISSKQDVFKIIGQLTPGAKTAADRKAMLVKIANRETDHFSQAPKTAKVASGLTRVEQAMTVRSDSTKAKVASTKGFTAADALALHNQGQDLSTIYRTASERVGAATANATVKAFIAGLKGTKTKVALSQIDCSLLKQKLGTSNGIVGQKKCASCVYRKAMYCGLTGGTLLSFPGMETAGATRRVASTAPKDGYGLLGEFEMLSAQPQQDIAFDNHRYAEVELTQSSSVDL